MDKLGLSEGRLMVAFSMLRRRGALTIFEGGRPRLYRLMKPENYMLIASGYVNLIDLRQGRYLNLIYDFYRCVKDLFKINSYAIYGSVARGQARRDSDVDILIVSRDFSGSISSRIDGVYPCIEEVSKEVNWLIDHNIYAPLSIYPLKPSELNRLPILLLDISEEAKIVYDDGTLDRVFKILRARLAEIGARKIVLGDGRWYWDLKPDYKLYELIDI